MPSHTPQKHYFVTGSGGYEGSKPTRIAQAFVKQLLSLLLERRITNFASGSCPNAIAMLNTLAGQ